MNQFLKRAEPYLWGACIGSAIQLLIMVWMLLR